jgi:hypothetical protein
MYLLHVFGCLSEDYVSSPILLGNAYNYIFVGIKNILNYYTQVRFK